MFKKIMIGVLVVTVLGGVGLYLAKDRLAATVFAPRVPSAGVNVTVEQEEVVQVLVKNLDIPWEILFMPSGEMLVTERPGTIARLGAAGMIRDRISVPGVNTSGESGLLGAVLHPDFENNQILYLYETYKENGTKLNRVASYIYVDNVLTDKQIIVDAIPGAVYHDGGRIAFGPDEKLYVATGDATTPRIAQDVDSLGGKILRMNADGSVPDDNPTDGSFVYSLGHRNPQGLAWDNTGRLWSTEHGPSGGQSGYDELNIITPGGNYGWPHFAGDTQMTSVALERSGYVFPVLDSGADDTWAPASVAYHNGYVYWGGLRGQALYRVAVNDAGEIGSLERFFFQQYKRIRTVVVGPNNNLYFTTSNTDGRAVPSDGDDLIVKFDVGN